MSNIDTPFRSPGDGGGYHGSPRQATPLAATRLHYELAEDRGGADHSSRDNDPAARRAARLYTTRDDHFRHLDEQRMAAARERAEAELRGATFAPVISSRSRQLVHDDARPASERLFEDAMQRKYRQGRHDASQHSSRSASVGAADHSGVPSSIHPSNVSYTSSAAASDAGDKAALPRVAREYHVAAVEHDWHVELLRAEQREKEAAMCAPVLSRNSPPRGPAPESLPAPTRADDFRAAAARAKIDRDRAARRNPLEDATHRKRNETLLQEAQARAAREKEREAARLARKASGADGPPEPVAKKQSRTDVAAVSQRLFKEAEARAKRQQESELAEREAARQLKAAAEKRRQEEYIRMKAAHDEAMRAAAEAAPAPSPTPAAAAEATGFPDEKPVSVEPATATAQSPRHEEQADGTPLRKRAAAPVATSVVSSALLKRRQEAAAEAVKERRLKAEAMRKAKEDEAKAIAERSQRLPLRPRTGGVRSSSSTSAARPNVSSTPVVADGPSPSVVQSAALKPRPKRSSSADGARPAAAAEAQPPVVKGMDAYRLRREKADAMRREAEAKLHVKPSAVKRVRRADGKLVTHCDPFDNLERHEQASYERRIAVVEGHLAQEGPYAPATVGELYQPPAPAPARDANATIPSTALPPTVQSRSVSVPSSAVSGAIPH